MPLPRLVPAQAQSLAVPPTSEGGEDSEGDASTVATFAAGMGAEDGSGGSAPHVSRQHSEAAQHQAVDLHTSHHPSDAVQHQVRMGSSTQVGIADHRNS